MKKHRINNKIKIKEVMVIDADGTKLGVMETEEAIKIASSKTMDLVEVAPNSNPPVCKIMDFGRYKYKNSKKNHDSKKKQKIVRLKEVKMGPTIGEHDYDFKLDHIKKFLADGDKVKISIVFKGRMIIHKDLGYAVIDRVVEDLKDIAIIDQTTKSEGRQIFITLVPKK